MTAGSAAAIGVVTRTGWAVVVVLSGRGSAPSLLDRREVGLRGAGIPVQPYHAAAGLPADAAQELIGRAERGAEQALAESFRGIAAELPGGVVVCGVAVVVKHIVLPTDTAEVLRSHPRMHAAEGVLYREAALAAASRCGYTAHAVPEPELPEVPGILGELGRAAGRPWRRIEKDAARAAITLLDERRNE
jgi:hypothetical protein